MANIQFTEGYKDFPICNHIQDIGPENIGYQTGMFYDGLPFEVEEYEYGEGDAKVRELALIMPDLYVDEEDCEEPEYEFDYEEVVDDDTDWGYNAYYKKVEKSNVEPFHCKMELKECCVLPIGMVFRGQEDCFPIIKWYQEYIEETGIVEYISDVRSCSVFYYTDINGNDLVGIRIGLIINGNTEAVSNIELRDFPMRTNSNKISKQNLKLVK